MDRSENRTLGSRMHICIHIFIYVNSQLNTCVSVSDRSRSLQHSATHVLCTSWTQDSGSLEENDRLICGLPPFCRAPELEARAARRIRCCKVRRPRFSMRRVHLERPRWPMGFHVKACAQVLVFGALEVPSAALGSPDRATWACHAGERVFWGSPGQVRGAT